MRAENLIFALLLFSSLVMYAGYWVLLRGVLADRPIPSDRVIRYVNALMVATILTAVAMFFALCVYGDRDRTPSAIPSAILLYLFFASTLHPVYYLTLASNSGRPPKRNLKYMIIYGLLFTLALALVAFEPNMWYQGSNSWLPIALLYLLLPLYYYVVFAAGRRSREASQK